MHPGSCNRWGTAAGAHGRHFMAASGWRTSHWALEGRVLRENRVEAGVPPWSCMVSLLGEGT